MITLIGYGVSGKATLDYFMKNGIFPTVRCEKEAALPERIKGIFGDGYLDTVEDVIFRSPSIRPDRIRGNGKITTEASFALGIADAFKVGVTGSDGKSTTSTLIYKILEKSHKAYLGGNIGNALINFAPYAENGSFVVAELSSFQLIDFSSSLDTCVVTNITQNHLDWHLSFDEYVCAKKNIVSHSDTNVLNYDDDLVKTFANKNTTFFSLKNKRPENCEHFVALSDGYITYDGAKVISADKILLKGKFNLQNVMAAIGVTYNIAPIEDIRSVLMSFSGIAGRMEFVKKVGGVSFFDSSIDTTPSRTTATLGAFDNSKTVVILGGYDKNLSYDILKSSLYGIKYAVVCGSNKDKILKSINDVCLCAAENDFENAVFAAYEKAVEGDSVLLSPASASFDMFSNYKERSAAFRKIVESLK